MSLGMAVALGLWLLPGLSWPIVLIIACIVVPIDFAPAPSAIRDGQLPGRVRKLLNVEAGYNDGIVSPIFVFALAMADHQDGADTFAEQLRAAVPEAVLAIVVGLCVGGASPWPPTPPTGRG